MLDLSQKGSGVEPLHVPLDESLERASNEDFEKSHSVAFDRTFNIVARPLVWRDSSAEYYYPVARQQSRDETDTLDVGVAILAREPKSTAQVLANGVAVESFYLKPRRLELH